MVELGAFLADFHTASARSMSDRDETGMIAVATLAEDATWRPLELRDGRAETVRRALDDLRSGLERIDHFNAPRTVIHGDFTNHNVLASGTPPAPTGVIDFSNTYREATVADIGFALWRSGRLSQRATAFDPGRIAAYLGGYRSRRRLPPEAVDAVLVYLHARGLQILAKQARRGPGIDAPLVLRLTWLHHHFGDLRDAVTKRLSRRS